MGVKRLNPCSGARPCLDVIVKESRLSPMATSDLDKLLLLVCESRRDRIRLIDARAICVKLRLTGGVLRTCGFLVLEISWCVL